jgi:hypothetical protein
MSFQTDPTIDLNDGTHSRHNADHYSTCQPCYEDHLDHMEEMRMDAEIDAADMESDYED